MSSRRSTYMYRSTDFTLISAGIRPELQETKCAGIIRTVKRNYGKVYRSTSDDVQGA